MLKHCAGCGQDLPLDQFYVSRTTGKALSGCKSCNSRRNKEGWARHNSKRRATKKAQHLRERYNTTPEVYDALLLAQGGLCRICNKQKHLVVDHDHVTGEIRGLLCRHCNFAIGHALEDPAVLRAAADYLEQARLVSSGPAFGPLV